MDFHPSLNQLAVLQVPKVGGAIVEGINISLKNCKRAFIYCFIKKGADAATVAWTLAQSTGNAGAIAGTSEKAMTNVVPIWYSLDCTLSNLLTSTTAAKSYTQAATVTVLQLVVFEILPEACMDVAGGFDCVTINASDPAAANIAFAFAILDPAHGPMPTVYED
jgi:hypothetical protein